MKYLKPYNESIRHLLKPKSEEDIIKSTEKLNPLDKIEKALQYNYSELFKIGINELKGRPFDSMRVFMLLINNVDVENFEHLMNNVKKFDIDILKTILNMLKDLTNKFRNTKSSNFISKSLAYEKMFVLLKDKLNKSIPENDYDSLIQFGVKFDDFDIVKNALKNGAKIQDYYLNNSVRNNNYEITKYLLDNGVNPNGNPKLDHKKETPLVLSIKNNNVDIFKLLIELVDFTPKSFPIHEMENWITVGKNKEIVKYLTQNYDFVREMVLNNIKKLKEEIKKFEDNL